MNMLKIIFAVMVMTAISAIAVEQRPVIADDAAKEDLLAEPTVNLIPDDWSDVPYNPYEKLQKSAEKD
jgi:hypothetical protein